ncbi:efflux RND transporter periplasmic adaptor subunit [Coraliomargarita sp. SDUM461004]|uniref:Efflux RND transporter periplasmic adaptor subunit n=1 Tax=Thalassobacterium sedimentorum TaxID=3041258 RepID=A0ABU1AIL2_9BACT|nr:efflux RND transporter periplasmic adaptor subunit [Coraliomargarita sp. SDUM461004]MDQ8193463.1 efflux RND transporter periplasmic adaptor subunit [Coraliomargarita sp. SDUM461004]
MKRALISFCILVLIAGGIYGLLQVVPHSGGQPAREIRLDIAERRDLKSVVPATGEVLPLLSSIVKSEISGRITEIKIEEGETVVRDQVLLELDRTSLETRLREAQRSLEAERLRLEKSERNYRRLEELYAKKFVGEKEYLDAQTELHLAQLALEISQARLDDAAEDLSKTTILAPHDGVVTLLDVVEGQVISGASSVSNGSDLLTIAQLDELFMEANINEVDVEKLYIGQPAFLRFDAIPNFEVEGKISVIAPSARKDGNVRVFPIEVVFEVADNRVRPGISATVEVPIEFAENVVSVLLSGVFNDKGQSICFVQTVTGWERREVLTGINNLQHVEIRSGLEEGEVVALSRPLEFRKSND